MNWRTLSFTVAICLLLAGGAVPLLADNAATEAATSAYQEALAKFNAGDEAAAEQGFKRAAELAPRWGAPNGRLGAIYQLQGLEEQARAQYALTQAASFPQDEQLDADEARVRALIIANEAYTIYLVNAARLEDGQAILVPDPTMAVVARLHSDEMRDKNYFDHTSPTPGLTNCQDRFKAVCGYKPRLIGENVSRRWGSEYSLKPAKILQTHYDLMASPGHRKNILHPTFEWLGVGISVNAKGDYWLTEIFVQSGR